MLNILPSPSRLRKESVGLTMIAASLLVIAFITAYLVNHQRNTGLEELRTQGSGLVRLIGGLPLRQLVPEGARHSLLDVIKQSQGNEHFRYATVTGVNGLPLAEVVKPGTLVPAAPLPLEPTAWLGERVLQDEQGASLIEFYAPLLQEGELAAYLRLAYQEPGYVLAPGQLPLFATLAFAVFLLTPLFYFLVRREIKALGRVAQRMELLAGDRQAAGAQLEPSGELRDFMDRFSGFIDAASRRVERLEGQRSDEVLSNKLLHYQKARIESALQSLPEAVLVMDESGVITYGNARLNNLLGVDLQSVLGARPQDWCTNPDVLSLFAYCCNNSAHTFRSEAIEFSPGGAPEKTVSVSAHPLFSPKGSNALLGTLFVFRDITEDIVARQARGDFVAHMAHELKTPMNVINMYSETLQDDAGNNRELTIEASNVIHDEVERVSALISNLLSMTQIDMGMVSLDRKRVKFNDLVRDIVETMRRSDQAGDLSFVLNLPREVSAISVDKDLLRIAINNLLTNAIKYNRPGGEIAVSLEEDDLEIRVRIKDSGIGIREEEHDRIFERFYRSDNDAVREKTGHGLGLPLARQIVQLHHGELDLFSTPGEGAEFVIRFAKDTGLLKQAI